MNDLRTQYGLAATASVTELEVLSLQQEQVECPVRHYFAPGVCIREVSMPAGTFAIGHHQKYEHSNILLQGAVHLRNEDGTWTELRAPFFFVGKPGRKMGFITEDMVWLNVYATEEQDVQKIEEHFIDKSEVFLDATRLQQDFEHSLHEADRQDYQQLLQELKLTDEQVQAEVQDESNQIPLPFNVPVIRAISGIAGLGMFMTAPVKAGEVIGPALLNGKRTPLGRYVNHSPNPTAKMVKVQGDILLVSLINMSGLLGGQTGIEITVNYREVLALHQKQEELQCQQ